MDMSPLSVRIFRSTVLPQLPRLERKWFETQLENAKNFGKGGWESPYLTKPVAIIGTKNLSSEEIQHTIKLLSKFRGRVISGSDQAPQLRPEARGFHLEGGRVAIDVLGEAYAPYTEKEMTYITQMVQNLWASRGVVDIIIPQNSPSRIHKLEGYTEAGQPVLGDKMFEVHSTNYYSGGSFWVWGIPILHPTVKIELPIGGKIRITSLVEHMLGTAQQVLGWRGDIAKFEAAPNRGFRDILDWISGLWTRYGQSIAETSWILYVRKNALNASQCPSAH